MAEPDSLAVLLAEMQASAVAAEGRRLTSGRPSDATRRAAGVKLLSLAMDAHAVPDGLMVLEMLDIIPDQHADRGAVARHNGSRPKKVPKEKPAPKSRKAYRRRAATPEWVFRPDGRVLHAVRPESRSTVCRANLRADLEWREPTPVELEAARRCRACRLRTESPARPTGAPLCAGQESGDRRPVQVEGDERGAAVEGPDSRSAGGVDDAG